jgi:hypothetical protein
MQGGSIPPLFTNNLNLCGGGKPLTIMLNATKNLVKFVQKMNPSEEATLRLAVGVVRKEIDCLFYLNRGNGREMFAKLMTIPTITLTQRGTDNQYIDLVGEFDGYSVDITFLNEPNV